MTSGHHGAPEHDFEPIKGLPAELPDGEYIVWQGRPDARRVGRYVLKTRWVAFYFGLLALWALIAGLYDGRAVGSILISMAALAILASIVVGALELFAWGVHKTTLYTMTNKRLVFRIGVALSATFNLPFTQIVSADVRKRDGDAGDIALTLKGDNRMSWLVFWPHVRGLQMKVTVPQMICLPKVDAAAEMLATQMRSHMARSYVAQSAVSEAELAIDGGALGVAAE